MSETQLQFGQRLGTVDGSEPCSATRCPRCGQHFSKDGRFCPFDGEPLVRAVDWDPTGDPLLDKTIDGRYLVEAVIGEGGMGTVYRVRHVLLGKGLALKALRADLTNDGEIAARFLHEARVAASVSHPGLVEIVDFGTLRSGQPYLVMELLAGMPLSALLRRFGALSSARAVRITRLIAEALAALHAAGIVHRDLKPDNVQVESVDGVDAIKVVDFGLAKVMGQNRLTRAGVVFGTPHYMSPEQASGQSIDGRADLYSLGVVLYEMLVGRVPFEADTYMGVLTQHIYMKPVAPSVRLGNAAAFGAVEAVVLRCLQKQPEKRFQSSAELMAALEELEAGQLSEEPPAATAAPLVASDLALFEDTEVDHFEPRVPLRWVATLLAACAALGAAAALFFASSGRPAAVAPRAELARVAGPPAMHALRGAVDTLPAEASPVAPVLPAPPAPPPSAALSSATPDAGRTLTPTRAKHVGSTAKAVTPVTRSRALAGSDIIDPWAKSAPR